MDELLVYKNVAFDAIMELTGQRGFSIFSSPLFSVAVSTKYNEKLARSALPKKNSNLSSLISLLDLVAILNDQGLCK